jgi:excisionase family DNA binding protein
MVDSNQKLTFSIPEAAAELGISKTLAYSLARQGRLPGCLKIGQRRLIVSRFQLEAYLRNGDEEDHGRN